MHYLYIDAARKQFKIEDKAPSSTSAEGIHTQADLSTSRGTALMQRATDELIAQGYHSVQTYLFVNAREDTFRTSYTYNPIKGEGCRGSFNEAHTDQYYSLTKAISDLDQDGYTRTVYQCDELMSLDEAFLAFMDEPNTPTYETFRALYITTKGKPAWDAAVQFISYTVKMQAPRAYHYLLEFIGNES
ncbi:hypothetical protein MS_050 [Vibrio phage VPMS1]|uniref:hypothetical protein n=1 Tax=Vibrio phage VPMS1 TaxID=1233488 RepID=UPI0003585619|nr:hypothetical protein MS_050 [Vibrio phage VPMS1]AFV51129.1 lysozyme [Vibrio phage VPMS1]